MSTLKLLKSDWVYLGQEDADDLGANLLSGKTPKIIPLSEKPVTFEMQNIFGEQLLPILTDDTDIQTHIDIKGAPFCLTYALDEITEISRVCVSSYDGTSGQGNHAVNNFEVYASNTEEDLYSPENLLSKYYRSPEEEWKINGRANRDTLLDVEGSAKYIGVKFLSACPNDDITRISRVALFNDFNNAKYCFKASKKVSDALCFSNVSCEGDFSGNPCDLTNGRILIDEETVKANSDITLCFSSEVAVPASTLYIVGINAKPEELLLDGGSVPFTVETDSTFNEREIYTLCLAEALPKKLEIKFKKGAIIDTVFGNTSKAVATLDIEKVISPDYIGAGCNVFPNAFSDYAKREGYNEVYWELEKHHVSKANPHCIRMWFQIDWVVQTEEQYKTGDWQFDNPSMNSVLKYCEMFRDNGTEIELDFGWKVGSSVQDWFTIGGLAESQKECAAPKNLYNYAKAAVATLEYLILEKGFDNVKYISFYNEITNASSEHHYDFAMHGEAVAYWSALANYTKYFLDRSKVAGRVEIWAAEECCDFEQIMDKLNILAPNSFSRHSVHKYNLTYKDVCKLCSETFIPHSDGKPVLLTEFGNCYRTNKTWEQNTANNVLAAANNGVSGAFVWVMAGSPLVDPLNWMHSPSTSDESLQHWCFFPKAETLEDAGESFYELCLLNHYIPLHAASLGINPLTVYRNTRFNAFYKNGDYTFFVENNNETDTELVINLTKSINKTFYRHTYRFHEKGEGNLIVPETDKILSVDSTLKDTIDGGYSLTVYTTVKPIRQVIMDSVDIRVAAGSRVSVGATVLDDDLGQAPTFSISKSLIEGAYLDGGEVVIPESAKAGDMLSVKAELPTGEFGISIIRII